MYACCLFALFSQYSAILKNHIAKVVNSGKDAVSPSQLADALVSHNGIANVHVQLGTIVDSKEPSKPPPKKDKIGMHRQGHI